MNRRQKNKLRLAIESSELWHDKDFREQVKLDAIDAYEKYNFTSNGKPITFKELLNILMIIRIEERMRG